MKTYIICIFTFFAIALTSCTQTKTITVTVTYSETIIGGDLLHHVDGDSIWGLPVVETLKYFEDGLKKEMTIDYRTMFDSSEAHVYRNTIVVEGYRTLRAELAKRNIFTCTSLFPLESGKEYEFKSENSFRIYGGFSQEKMDSIYAAVISISK
jgi:hypothetical protein